MTRHDGPCVELSGSSGWRAICPPRLLGIGNSMPSDRHGRASATTGSAGFPVSTAPDKLSYRPLACAVDRTLLVTSRFEIAYGARLHPDTRRRAPFPLGVHVAELFWSSPRHVGPHTGYPRRHRPHPHSATRSPDCANRRNSRLRRQTPQQTCNDNLRCCTESVDVADRSDFADQTTRWSTSAHDSR